MSNCQNNLYLFQQVSNLTLGNIIIVWLYFMITGMCVCDVNICQCRVEFKISNKTFVTTSLSHSLKQSFLQIKNVSHNGYKIIVSPVEQYEFN